VSDVLAFVLGRLPPPPARVLEVGAGDGELARALATAGYSVLAIDPAAEGAPVEPVALLDVPAEPRSFDAAVACVSLHHVEPLAESCARLADVLRPGARLVVDEFDLDRFGPREAQWWLDRRRSTAHDEHGDAADVVARMREHIAPLSDVLAALAPWFDIDDPVRSTYLYRWDMPPGREPEELRAIQSGAIQATGARFTATRT
jgi:SAM-dependent methyltransferase